MEYSIKQCEQCGGEIPWNKADYPKRYARKRFCSKTCMNYNRNGAYSQLRPDGTWADDSITTKHICSFSTGLGSALTVEKVRERYGDESVVIVFMDTLMEDDDNYRFMEDMKKRWDGIEFIVLTEGRTPYEIAEAERAIPSIMMASCSRVLKMRMFARFLGDYNPSTTVIHIGFDYSEVHRCKPVRENYSKRGYTVDFPLLWRPIEKRPFEQVCRDDYGIEPPRMYDMGFSHANCGGTCVKQGQGTWAKTLANFPERYAKVERWELWMRDTVERCAGHSMLSRRVGGEHVDLTLEQFRLEIEAGAISDEDLDEPCISCGIGVIEFDEE